MKIANIFNYRKIILALGDRGFFNFLDDKKYIKLRYYCKNGKKLNIDNPVTYNEKLQWLKLHDHKDFYSKLVDKYEVKEYVKRVIGEEYIIPTIGVYNKFEEIDFEKLPNQFVIKCTHDSGGIFICKDKTTFDIEKARKKINRSLKRNYYYYGREWPYKNVIPRIIVEKYMEDDSDKELKDYKIYTFNGKAKIMFIASGRQDGKTVADYFDESFNFLDFTWGYPHAKILPSKPKNYELMFELAEKLSQNNVELRVDFYEVNGKLYFGEITFFDGSGFDPIVPQEWDYKLGSYIDLNKLRLMDGEKYESLYCYSI